mmetsp:Transcript_6591/g.17679  ORF Transcript_6591/g.17679 Transcript_6591/m.17679 type:complete len:306 (+) Transcript_6591:116-1033(+)
MKSATVCCHGPLPLGAPAPASAAGLRAGPRRHVPDLRHRGQSEAPPGRLRRPSRGSVGVRVTFLRLVPVVAPRGAPRDVRGEVVLALRPALPEAEVAVRALGPVPASGLPPDVPAGRPAVHRVAKGSFEIALAIFHRSLVAAGIARSALHKGGVHRPRLPRLGARLGGARLRDRSCGRRGLPRIAGTRPVPDALVAAGAVGSVAAPGLPPQVSARRAAGVRVSARTKRQTHVGARRPVRGGLGPHVARQTELCALGHRGRRRRQGHLRVEERRDVLGLRAAALRRGRRAQRGILRATTQSRGMRR